LEEGTDHPEDEDLVWKCTQKYGVELPRSVKQVLAINRNMGTSFWNDAIEKEMKIFLLAFKFRDDDVMPPGFKKIHCYMVFKVKLDLVHKSRFVAGGHQTDLPKESVYSRVISHNSVPLAYIVTGLINLEILSADAQNALSNEPTKEKIYAIAGPEFGQTREGQLVMIVLALYGLWSRSARWHDHLATALQETSFKACKADTNVWMRPAVKSDGSKYYEYVLCYVDILLVVSEQPKGIMDGLEAMNLLKARWDDVSQGRSLKVWLEHSENLDKVSCSLLAEAYVNWAIKDVETELEKVSKALPAKVLTPTMADYHPELDQSRELRPEQSSYFAGLIGALKWCIKLGQIDIIVGGLSAVSVSCLTLRGAHSTSAPCLRVLEETCTITDGVQQDGAGYQSIAFSEGRLD
jgi:hypothetical protein